MNRISTIVIALLCCACQAGPSDESSSRREAVTSTARDVTNLAAQSADFGMPLESLAPPMRESLQEIKVFRLTNDNIDTVWDFKSEGPEGILLLDCNSEVLSAGRMERIATWAKKGHGIIVQASQLNLSPYLLPSPNYLEGEFSEDGWGLAENSELLRNVGSLGNPLWCADLSPIDGLSGAASLRFRRFPRERGNTLDSFVDDVDSIFSNANERFLPVIVGIGDGGERKFVLLASTFKGARVLWFSGRFDFEKECSPEYDDAIFWSNLMHWLATKPLPEEEA